MPLQSPKDDPVFVCELQLWHDGRLFGSVHPDEWDRLRLRGFVEIIVSVNGHQKRCWVAHGGEFYKSMGDFDKSADELGLTEPGDYQATFRVDWERVTPPEFEEAAQHDPAFAKLWNNFDYEYRCEILKPIRRSRTDDGRIRRTLEALTVLKLLK